MSDKIDTTTDEKILNEMQGHNYDGIVECDNPMPGWWVWTFLFTIIFAFIYFIHYSFGGGPTLADELRVAMAAIEKNKTHEPVLNESEQGLKEAMDKEDMVAAGSVTFTEKCAVCHGAQLQGQIGPNLVDAYWIHGKGTRLDLVTVVRQGVLDMGMPAWGQILDQKQIYAVSAFILSKKGSQPSNPKAPQGNLVQE